MRLQAELDVLIKRLARATRMLPALTADNGAEERARLVGCLERREPAEPRFETRPPPSDPQLGTTLARARSLAAASVARDLYLARLDELELELRILEALGDPRSVRPLARQRFGDASVAVPAGAGTTSLREIARGLLERVEPDEEPRVVPARASDGSLSLEGIMAQVARAAGLPIAVQVEPRLVANAAAGERTVFIADRLFGLRECVRLAAHELLGHLVAAANGRAQRLALLAVGTAGSFTSQEGLAIYLEEAAGLLDGRRVRTFAARVVTADAMHAGARFGEVARLLVDEHAFSAREAVVLAERAFRGGGVARDIAYLRGWLEVRAAIARRDVTVDELRLGKVGLTDVPALRELMDVGAVRPGPYMPSLARSLGATGLGTSLETSPPSLVTSLQRLDAT